MSAKYIVNKINLINENEIQLEIGSNNELDNCKASGQMIVDSDGLSFVYLLETDEAYTYLVIPNTLWKELKEALDNHSQVSVTNSTKQILLDRFNEELSYLIENIKGNSNYGERMVTEVEEIFAS